jgi:predicted NACHT family NTPase
VPSKTYPRKRYWLPRGGPVTFSDDGYVIDPESFGGKIYGADLVTLDQLSSKQCLILLGEPGIGKSTTLKSYQASSSSNTTLDAPALWFDLGEYQTDARLRDEVFANEVIRDWRDGEGDLRLYLDSFDECQLDVPVLTKMLVSQLARLPLKRLYLRLVCRTAAWPSDLEDRLRELFRSIGSDLGVYELVPLRRTDVHLAAGLERLDADHFVHEIDVRDIVPLAIKPVTLRFLLGKYREAGYFPPTQQELYEYGCRLLCEETNPDRFGSHRSGELTADQRLAVASRIAALTIVSPLSSIWQGIDYGDVPPESITVPTMCGDDEVANGYRFTVTEAVVRETLATGLFSSRGPQRLGWVHETYAEFLAARCLVKHGMSPSQMWSLVSRVEDDGREKVIPQLSDTAAWLASMVPEIRDAILEHDPDVLLRSYAFTASDVQDRSRLVESLLDLLDNDQISGHDRDRFRRYRHLAHPELANQLQRIILDVTRRERVREAAIEIAAMADVKELQNELADIALDPTNSRHVRVRAAWAISRIGDAEARRRLLPLLELNAETDPDDELKGSVLTAVWPAQLTAEELFHHLTRPRQTNLLGRYKAFAEYELPRRLRPSDLPAALEWVAQQPTEPTPALHPFRSLIDAVMVQGWDNLYAPGVLGPFARATWSRLHGHDEIARGTEERPFRESLVADDQRRRQVIDGIIPLMSEGERDAYWLVAPPTALALTKDVLWLLGRLRSETRPDLQWALIRLIQFVADPQDRMVVDAIYEECQHNEGLAGAFGWWFRAVPLDSEEARRLKEEYARQHRRMQRRATNVTPPPAERVARLLDEFEKGNVDAWWLLNRELTLEPTSEFYGNEFEADISVLPGWRESDAETRSRIVEAARRFAREGDPHNDQWLGTDTLHRPAFAGFRALRLLLQEDPFFLDTLSEADWKQWAPAIVSFPDDQGRNLEAQKRLIALAYAHAPDEVIQTVLTIAQKENREHGNLFVLYKVETLVDRRLAESLRQLVTDPSLRPEALGEVLRVLLRYDPPAAQDLVGHLLPLPLPAEAAARERAVVVARSLVQHAPDAGWTIVWPLFESDIAFGRSVIELVAHPHDFLAGSVSSRLTENQIADLFVWLVREYPPAQDPKLDGGGWVGPRENLAHFRDALIIRLRDRGTAVSCQAIRWIREQLPELSYLKKVEAAAHTIRRARSWQAPSPTELLRLIHSRDRRFVESGDQLLDVLVESLKRLEAKLRGETPARIFLWNEWGYRSNTRFRPKTENDLSDYVKLHLDEDLKGHGIIVNREVEIRRKKGAEPGQRTDIQVDAIRQSDVGSPDVVTAIIEVKGSWHDELDQAMRSQLRDRYLAESHCHHGLYLVGWFNCPDWDDADSRQSAANNWGLSLDEARRSFDHQASELSTGENTLRALVINTSLR